MRLSRRFRPINMNGCVLYLPFYAYGANAQKAWDISGQGNHGIPTVSGPGVDYSVNPAERVTNGLFASDSGWTKGTGWTIASARATKVAGTASDLEQDISPIVGETYLLDYEVGRTTGSVSVQLGGVNGSARSAHGVYEEVVTAISTENLKFQADADYAGYVRRIYCRKIESRLVLGWNFNGSTSQVLVPDFVETGNSAKELSVLWWIYPHFKSHYMLSHYSSIGSQAGWQIQQSSTLNPPFIVLVSSDGTFTSGTGKYYTSSLTMKSFCWNCIAFSFNAGILSIYVAGVVDPNPTKTYDAAITTIHNSTADILVGGEYVNGILSGIVLGSIGEALIFNRALSTQEHKDFFEMTRSRYGV